MIKALKRFQFPQQETINLKNDDTNQNDRFPPKKTVTVKTGTRMKKFIPTKMSRGLRKLKKKKQFHLLIIRMIEAMCEQSPEYFKQFRKNFIFFFLNNEPKVFDLPSNTNFAFAVHSNQNEFCSQSPANGQPHYHVLIKVTKECTGAVNKMTLKSFIVPCLLSSFKCLIMGCSKYHLSVPLMEKMEVAVNYNSTSNLDAPGASLRKRLPQICFASQTQSIQS